MFYKLFPFLESQKELDFFFEKWFLTYYKSDDFQNYIGFDESEVRDSFDNKKTNIMDLSFNYQLKTKYLKIYNQEFEKYKLNSLKNVSKKWFNNRLKQFELEINNIADLKNNNLKCFRALNVDNKKEFIKCIKNGSCLDGYEGIGIYWAWDRERADAHWGDGTEHILLKALIPLSSINIEETVMLNLDPSIGYEEAEIRLHENAEVICIGINDEYFSESSLLRA